ncbi:MAG: hypothetical protein AAGE52_02950 [Myxococcota bacterium]
MGTGHFPWLSALYEVLDTDFEEPPDRRSADEIAPHVASMTPIEALAWVLVHEMGGDDLQVFEPLVDRPGGERLYHGALALTQAPPYLDHGSFADAKVTAPEGRGKARFLIRMRDYAAKGERDRVWFMDQNVLYSVSDAGKITKEVDDPETFVHALRSALL